MTYLKPAEKHGNKFLNPVETSVGGIGMMWKVLPLYLGNREERVPKKPLGPFKTDPNIYLQPPTSGLRVTWFGHSSLLLEMDELRVLIDPVWDQRASPVRWFGPKRFFAPTLRLEEMPRIDVVLISHDHFDHLGRMTIERLARLGATRETRWITPLGVGELLKSFGVEKRRISEMDWMDEISVRDGALTITALPSRHFSGRSLSSRNETLWASYILRGPSWNVYYGADSGFWDGFAEIGRAYGPFDLTMLEIGAYNDLWSDIHMGPDGAARTFGDLGGNGLLMPIHWGLFDLALHAWRQPIERITELADKMKIKLWSPAAGAPTEVVSGREVRSQWWKQGC